MSEKLPTSDSQKYILDELKRGLTRDVMADLGYPVPENTPIQPVRESKVVPTPEVQRPALIEGTLPNGQKAFLIDPAPRAPETTHPSLRRRNRPHYR